MKGDGSLPPTNDLSARLALLQAANEGRLENLRCPQCGEAAVSVWFAHPAVNVYRTWFVCDRCSFEMRARIRDPRCIIRPSATGLNKRILDQN